MEILNVNTIARLKVFGRPNNLFVDLYLPEEVWMKLVKALDGNRLTVTLRFEGEDGTKILKTEMQIAGMLIEIRDYATEIEAKAEDFKEKGDIDMHDFLEWRAMKIKGLVSKIRKTLGLKPLSEWEEE